MNLRALLLCFLLPLAALSQTAQTTPDRHGGRLAAIPHGTLHRETFVTKFVKGLPGDQDRFVVYTPPGYDANTPEPYPVLYLLHGWGDTVDGWVRKGHADQTLDRLIAAGKVKPMVVVMPLGYGDMAFLSNGFEVWRDEDLISNNVNRFGQALLGEIMPQVDRTYHVATDREHRAIAGLSMGGLEALTIGLRHAELFGSIGGFSSAIFPVAGQDLTQLDAKKEDLRLLWVACGTDDDLLSLNRIFEMHMKQQGLPVTVVETPGGHEWPVWRDDLNQFLPLLFQGPGSQGSGSDSRQTASR